MLWKSWTCWNVYLGGGFKYCLFPPLLGEMIQFDKYFSVGLKPPTIYECFHTFFTPDLVSTILSPLVLTHEIAGKTWKSSDELSFGQSGHSWKKWTWQLAAYRELKQILQISKTMLISKVWFFRLTLVKEVSFTRIYTCYMLVVLLLLSFVGSYFNFRHWIVEEMLHHTRWDLIPMLRWT